MRIVLLIVDGENRNLVIGPFESVDDAESFAGDVRPVVTGESSAMVTTIVSPGEYLATDDISTLEVDNSPIIKKQPDDDNNPTYHMSGNYYVPMMMRDSDPRGNKPRPTRIRTPNRCSHETEVCVSCLSSWEADYIVYFSRTQGGRRLARDAGRVPESY